MTDAERVELDRLVKNMPTRDEHAMCCFCGDSVAIHEAVTLCIYRRAGGARLHLWAHYDHVARAVDSNVDIVIGD